MRSRIHILVVEDDEFHAAFARTVLESAGYQVEVCNAPRQFRVWDRGAPIVPQLYDEAGHRVATVYLNSVLDGHMPAEKLLHYREYNQGLPGHLAIGHTRYSTAGESRLQNAQPMLIDCAHGQIAIAHNGSEWTGYLDGLQVIREIRSGLPSDVTIFVITAGGAGEETECALREEADVFLQKPVDLSNFRRALQYSAPAPGRELESRL